MRQIKFRAWDKKGKRFWTQKEMTEIGGFYYTHGVDPDPEEYALMQYTGLHDKNGKEIYEGDILELGEPKVLRSSLNDEVTYMPIGGSGSLLKVYFENGCFRTKEGVLEDILSWHNSFVKGNLYENPELIE